MPLLLDIATYLTSLGITQGDGVDTFRDYTPESPDNIVVLYEYASDPVSPYEELVHRSIQISVRNVDADAARIKALQIFNSLKANDHIVAFTDNRWGQVYLRQTPFKRSTEDTCRTIYGFNIGITTTFE